MADTSEPLDDLTPEPTGDFLVPDRPRRRRSVRLAIGGRTDPGTVRENNEDQFLAARLARSVEVVASGLDPAESAPEGEDGHLLIVADGMGGVAGGERASALAVATVLEEILRGFRPFLHREEGDDEAIVAGLRAAMDRADRAVLGEAADEPGLQGMGTTLTLLYAVSDRAYVLHAGDSRVYRLRRGTLDRITTDHSLVQRLVENGTISPEAARTHPSRYIVTNVVGGPGDGVVADVHRLTIEEGDLFLLCTDGLTEPVAEARIATILGDEPDPESAASALVAEAIREGGPDNVTVIVARATVVD